MISDIFFYANLAAKCEDVRMHSLQTHMDPADRRPDSVPEMS